MRTIFAVFTVTVVAVLVGFRYHAPSSTDLDTVLQAIEDSRAAIKELDVTYTFNAVAAPPNAVTLNTHEVQYLDGMIVVQKTWGADPDHLFSASAGYDGDIRWQKRGDDALVLISGVPDEGGYPSKLPYLDAQGGGLFDIMAWFPCHEARYGEANSGDLLATSHWDAVSLRKEKEWVGEAECFVIDYISNGEVRKTAWIDPARGYLPILQRGYSVQPYSVEFRIDKAVEAAPGIWIPTVGTRVVPARADVGELSAASEYVMEVQFLSVNSGSLHAENFDHTNWTPAGTTIFDLDTEEMWLASARDYSEAADVILTRATSTGHRLDAAEQPLTTVAPWWNAYWITMIVGCALASAMLVVKGRR